MLNEQLPLCLNLLMSKTLACSCQSVRQAPHYILKHKIKELTEMSGSSLLSCLLQKSKFKIITSNNKALPSLQFSPLCRAERDTNLQKEKSSRRREGLTHGLWKTLYGKGPYRCPSAIPYRRDSLRRNTAASPGPGQREISPQSRESLCPRSARAPAEGGGHLPGWKSR